MNRILAIISLSTALMAFPVSSHADPIVIDVDCGVVVARGAEPLRYGVCANYLIDSDDYDPERKHKIRESLRNLKVKAIRWNEGEIGDKMIWSSPPFEVPDAYATHLRTPGTVRYNWRVDGNGETALADYLAREAGDIDVFLDIGNKNYLSRISDESILPLPNWGHAV